MSTYIKITDKCNLRCPFCYNSNKDSVENLDAILKAIDKINPQEIIFHGGEPLLRSKDILYIMSIYPDKRYSITSNMTVNITEEIEKILSLCKVATSYSVDRFLNNNYAKFKSNVKYLRDWTLIVTLTRPQLAQSHKYLVSTIEELNPTYITYERLWEKQEDKILYKITDRYLLSLFKNTPITKNTLALKMKDSLKYGVGVFGCYNSIINPDGTYYIGCVQENKLTNKFSKNCLSCSLYRYCRGDCLAFRGRCAFPKKTFLWLRSQINEQ